MVSGGRWFAKNVTKQIGNNNNTLFWLESWLGEEVVKGCVSELFNLRMGKMFR